MSEQPSIRFGPLADFLEEHVAQEKAFRFHQAALMSLDFVEARQRLRDFSNLLAGHMQVEEELLLPLYAERVGQPQRLGVDIYLSDHRKILRIKGEITELFEELARRERATHDEVIDLFDRELQLKRLMHHHDDRERAGLFPLLDQALSQGEKEELWGRVEALRTNAPPSA